MTPLKSNETDNLRNSGHIGDPALPSAYGASQVAAKSTTALPIGTQARFIKAAATAAELGRPINALITIRWVSLFSADDVNPLRVLPHAECVRHLVELLRKWMARHGIPPYYIWVRENADTTGEHWHFACSAPNSSIKDLVRFVAHLTGEPRLPRLRSHDRLTEGEVARGELGSWHVARDTAPERQGYFLAAYLGKAEPSSRMFRGHVVENTAKPVRGCSFGGLIPDGRYDSDQGVVIGTTTRQDRFFISNALKRASAECAT